MDDAVLSAWAVLQRPGPLEVVDVFTGVPKPGFVTRYDRVAGASDSARMVRQRLDEDRQALALAGRRAIRLGFLDEQYRQDALDRQSVAEAVEKATPSASALFLPAGLGGHSDHLATRDTGRDIADRLIPLFLYAELPYAVRYGWPHWVTGATSNPNLDPEADWNYYLDSTGISRDSLQPEVVCLGDRESDEKLAAMRTYRTQFPSVNSGIVNRLANAKIRRYEVLWRVTPSGG